MCEKVKFLEQISRSLRHPFFTGIKNELEEIQKEENLTGRQNIVTVLDIIF